MCYYSWEWNNMMWLSHMHLCVYKHINIAFYVLLLKYNIRWKTITILSLPRVYNVFICLHEYNLHDIFMFQLQSVHLQNRRSFVSETESTKWRQPWTVIKNSKCFRNLKDLHNSLSSEYNAHMHLIRIHDSKLQLTYRNNAVNY